MRRHCQAEKRLRVATTAVQVKLALYAPHSSCRDIYVYSGADISARRRLLHKCAAMTMTMTTTMMTSTKKSTGRVYKLRWTQRGWIVANECPCFLDEAMATRACLIQTWGAHARPRDRRPRKWPRSGREFRIWHDAARVHPRSVILCLSPPRRSRFVSISHMSPR